MRAASSVKPRFLDPDDPGSSEQGSPNCSPFPFLRSTPGSNRLLDHPQSKPGVAMPIFSRPGRLRYGTHEALTLSEWFREHFIDSAVYLAGALRWIAISTKS